ncbi:MAG: hypothetical protein FP813_07620 [Desulfurivibrio sp.]|nr:hypothetical protein [Desulfurivibrio sp.]
MKNSGKVVVLFVLMAVLVAAVAGLYFKGDALMGLTRFTPKAIPNVTAVSCGDTWTKVFEGSLVPEDIVDNGTYGSQYPLTVTKAIKYSDLWSLASQGCSFKVVRVEGSGGISGQTTFECSVAGTYGGDGMFTCRTPMISGDGFSDSEYYEGAKISFAEYPTVPTVYYVPLKNQADPINLTVSIFTKK